MNEEDTKDYFARRPHWSEIKPFPPYALYPPTVDPWVPTFWINFPHERKMLQEALKKPKRGLIIPKTTYPEVLRCGWPPRIEPSEKFPHEMLLDAEKLSFKDTEKKYGYRACGPYSPFIKKRVKSRPSVSFECDHQKSMTREEILAHMKYFTYYNLKGKPRRTKVPIIHSDGIHYVLPSWQYCP